MTRCEDRLETLVMVFYFFFVIITGMVIMALFIGAITMAMFSAFEKMKMTALTQE